MAANPQAGDGSPSYLREPSFHFVGHRRLELRANGLEEVRGGAAKRLEKTRKSFNCHVGPTWTAGDTTGQERTRLRPVLGGSLTRPGLDGDLHASPRPAAGGERGRS